MKTYRQYLRLLSLSDQYYYYFPVWDLSRYLETQRELLSGYPEVIGQWFYGFQFTSPINKELKFSRDYYVKDYPEQHQFACHQLGICRKTLSIGKYLGACQNFSARWRPQGAGPLILNLGPPYYLGIYQSQKVEIKNAIRYGKVLALDTRIFPLGGAVPPNVNLGPLLSPKLLELES